MFAQLNNLIPNGFSPGCIREELLSGCAVSPVSSCSEPFFLSACLCPELHMYVAFSLRRLTTVSPPPPLSRRLRSNAGGLAQMELHLSVMPNDPSVSQLKVYGDLPGLHVRLSQVGKFLP